MTAIGVVLLLTSALGISLYLMAEGKQRITALEAVCSLIGFIRQNIKTFGTPLDGILDSCRIEYFEKISFGPLLRQKGLAVAAKECTFPIDRNAKLEFEAFAESAGKGYRDEEIKRCEYYLSRFEAYLATEKERFHRLRPMYRYLPILGALSVIIMLI